MSSDILARIDAFAQKAYELCKKGHLLRAAENFGRAAEAARPIGADNLVALCMLLRQGDMLGAYATSAPNATADPHMFAAHRAQAVAFISAAVGICLQLTALRQSHSFLPPSLH